MADAAPELFSAGWAELVRAAVDDGPTPEAMAAKLDTYWDWVGKVRGGYADSWALGVRALPGTAEPAYLLLTWRDGRCVGGEIVADPGGATYVLVADHADWVALLQGFDPGRAVMYRRLVLERGDVLTFFRGVYFVIESLHRVVSVPAAVPAAA